MEIRVIIEMTGQPAGVPDVAIVLSVPQAGSLFSAGPDAVADMLAACATHAKEMQAKEDSAAVDALLRNIPRGDGSSGNLN